MPAFPSVGRVQIESIVEQALTEWPEGRAYTIIELCPKEPTAEIPRVKCVITAEEWHTKLAASEGSVLPIVNDVCIQIMRHGVAVLEDR